MQQFRIVRLKLTRWQINLYAPLPNWSFLLRVSYHLLQGSAKTMARIYSLLTFVTLVIIFTGQTYGQSFSTVVNNGASSNRVDMIIIGDGYTASQINTDYTNHVNGTIDYFFNNPINAPLNRYAKFFNVHRVNVISNESGADKPLDNIFVDTALDASYSWGGGVERCLYFNTNKANNIVANVFAGTGIDTNDGLLLGTVNDSKYGGCGGQWGVFAGANSSAYEIAAHEIGHSFAGLADEYFYTNDHYSGGEFSQWNVTNDPNSGKWDRWVGYDDPGTDIGPIGYYEGGRYNATGVWRPSDNSKMRALFRPFDAISREKFIYEIYQEVDPLDSWYVASLTDEAPSELWVSTVDSDIIDVEWFLDGQSLGIYGETLDIGALGLSKGTYEFTAFAYDSILNHSFSGNEFDWWRLDPSMLQQSVSWTFTISIPEPSTAIMMVSIGGVLLLRRRRAV